MTTFIILFIFATVLNVVLNTLKTMWTANGGKWLAAIINAVTFGFYTYIIILTAGDELDTLTKAIITAICNFICVYFVKLIEEKLRKDKLWKVEVTIPRKYEMIVKENVGNVPYSTINIDNDYTLFNFYCATQNESLIVKDIVNQYNARYFASETKIL